MGHIFKHIKSSTSKKLFTPVLQNNPESKPWLIRSSSRGYGFLTLDYWSAEKSRVKSHRFYFDVEENKWQSAVHEEMIEMAHRKMNQTPGGKMGIAMRIKEPQVRELLVNYIKEKGFKSEDFLVPDEQQSNLTYPDYDVLQSLKGKPEEYESVSNTPPLAS